METTTETELYLIALIPHTELEQEIRSMKEYMRDHFYTTHALKSPSHITLKMPFKFEREGEEKVMQALSEFAEMQSSFRVELNGFGCFSPRVIFLNIVDHQPILNLHDNLNKSLEASLQLGRGDNQPQFHPHLTIATKDLERRDFYDAWPEFQNQKFEANFTVGSIFLLKHNGRNWDTLKEFPFGN